LVVIELGIDFTGVVVLAHPLVDVRVVAVAVKRLKVPLAVVCQRISCTTVEKTMSGSTVKVNLCVTRSVLGWSVGTVERGRLNVNVLPV
jgi:hypothetical protein